MKIRTKIIISFLILVIPFVIVGGFSFWGLKIIQKDINQDIRQNIGYLETATKLNSLTQFIRYYDEVLTQSARNYAFTGDEKWKVRYLQNVPLLDSNIKEALKLGDEEDKQLFSSVDAANLALVEMEETALNLVDLGQQKDAIKILEGEEYAKQKDIYSSALIRYFEKQGKKYSETLTTSTGLIIQAVDNVGDAVNQGAIETIFSVTVTIILAIILGLIIAWQISKPILRLKKVAKEITSGNLSARAEVMTKNEIGELSASFNDMTDQLQKTQENIEAKVKERTAELEKINKYMTGRELKMIELKKELKETQEKLTKVKK